jgi:hypothetical protein
MFGVERHAGMAGTQYNHQIAQPRAAGRIAEPDIQIEHGTRCAVQIEQTFDEGRTMRQRHWTHRVYDAFHIADGKTERAPPGIEQQNFA